MSPPLTPAHQAVAACIHRLLAAAVGPELEVLEAVGVQLPSGVLVPDIAVASARGVWSGARVLARLHLLLVVEVVSPSSTTTDRVTKPTLYAGGGVPAYWRVELTGSESPYLVAYRLLGSMYAEEHRASRSQPVDVDWPVRLRLTPADWQPAH